MKYQSFRAIFALAAGRNAIRVAASVALSAQWLLIGTAHAAEEPTSAQYQLTEIVVTATHVATAESKTPISMEVYTQAELQTKGVRDVQTLIEQDPSLNFASANGTGFITMRGISGSGGSGAGGVGAAVPIAFDGFYYNLNYVFNLSLYDMSRIEVLRGPQGTLFGRNASGGLINVVTNDPGTAFGGYAQLGFGNYNAINAEGALNLPVSDTFQVRFAWSSAQHSGYRTMFYGADQQADDQDAHSGRIKLMFEPMEQLRILATFQLTHLGGFGTTDNIFNLPADANNLPTHVAIPLTNHDAQVYNLAFAPQVNIDDRLAQLRVDYSALPWGMTLTYLGGYDQLSYLHSTPLVGLDAVQYGVPTTIELLTEQDPNTQNHELRLVSATDRSITWQGGFYYYRSTMANNDSHFRDTAAPGSSDLVAFLYKNEQKSTAAYGQAAWHLGPTIFSAGARYTRDNVGQTDLTSPADGIHPAIQSTQYGKWTWHVGEDWNITDKNLLYVKADTGYRAGAFNLYVPVDPTQPSVIEPYAPEFVTAYELGSKNRLLDERLLLNADVFYMRYSGQQLSESNQGGAFTVNAKASNIYGLETQLSAIVNPLGRFDLSATWLHARFDSQVFTNALLQSYDIGGNQLLQSPSFSVTAGFEHVFAVGAVYPRASAPEKYQTGQYYDFYNFPDSYQSAYTRTDLHLIYAARIEKTNVQWSLDACVRNMENSRVFVDESESFAPPLTQPGTYNVGFSRRAPLASTCSHISEGREHARTVQEDGSVGDGDGAPGSARAGRYRPRCPGAGLELSLAKRSGAAASDRLGLPGDRRRFPPALHFE